VLFKQVRHEADHPVDVLRRPGGEGGTGDAERLHVLVVFTDVPPGDHVNSGLFAAGPVDDLVVDIGEVLHIGDVKAPVAEITGDHIETTAERACPTWQTSYAVIPQT